MEALVLLQVVLGFSVGAVAVWSGLTLSPYVVSGKSALVAFTLFWAFNPNWFTAEGQEVFRKERKRVAIVVGAFLIVAVISKIKLLG